MTTLYLFEKTTHQKESENSNSDFYVAGFPKDFRDTLKEEMENENQLDKYFNIKNNDVIQIKGMWVADLMIGDFRVFILPKILKKRFSDIWKEGNKGDLEETAIKLEEAAVSAFSRVSQMMQFSSYPVSNDDDFLCAGSFPELSPLAEYVYSKYINELDKTLRRYSVNDFIAKASDRTAFRGKLLVAQHLKRNAARPTRFYTLAQELHEDNFITRVFFHALRIIRRYSKNSATKNKADRLSANLNITEVQKLDLQLVKRYKLPRKHGKIKKVYEMAKALVISEGISGGQKTTFGFAFNMEKVFECYVRKLFQEFLPNCTEEPHEGRIWLCSEERYIDKIEGFSLVEPNGERVLLKPDIVYQEKEDDEFKIIVDCKWKFWNWNLTKKNQSQKNTKQREDIESKDIRQLFIYQMAYKKRKGLVSKIFLIYPSFEDDVKREVVENEDDKKDKFSRFVIGENNNYPLWAFSLPVFKITGSESDECLIIFDDNEEQRCWLKIEEKLKAIAEFQKNSPKK